MTFDASRFEELLRYLKSELDDEYSIYTQQAPPKLWCMEFARFAKCNIGSNISLTEKELLTPPYRKPFIAWLKLQQ